MADLYHQVGDDLSVDATGDLLVAQDSVLTQQRILRRLLTPALSYLWQLDYGGSLPSFIGNPANAKRIAAVIRAQMLLEQGVAKVPVPSVSVSAQPDGTVVATMRYADAHTGESLVLTCPVAG